MAIYAEKKLQKSVLPAIVEDSMDSKSKENAPSVNAVIQYFDKKIMYGTELPSDDIGEDGDIFLLYTEQEVISWLY